MNFNLQLIVLTVSIYLCHAMKLTPDNYELTPCVSDEECEHLENATCKSNHCFCNGSFNCIYQPEIIVTKIGESCKYNSECNIEEAECRNRKCVCKDGFVSTISEKECLKISEGLGGSCETSVQCSAKVPLSECEENKCICQQHSHEFNGTCFKDIGLGQVCSNHGECSFVASSTCNNSKCSCKEGYVPNGNTCYTIAKSLNAPCFVDEQCSQQLGGAFCSNGFCKCKQSYVFKEKTNKCVGNLLFGEKCMEHKDCYDNGIVPNFGKLECLMSVCKCKSFYIEKNGLCSSGCLKISVNKYLMAIVVLIMFKLCK